MVKQILCKKVWGSDWNITTYTIVKPCTHHCQYTLVLGEYNLR